MRGESVTQLQAAAAAPLPALARGCAVTATLCTGPPSEPHLQAGTEQEAQAGCTCAGPDVHLGVVFMGVLTIC